MSQLVDQYIAAMQVANEVGGSHYLTFMKEAVEEVSNGSAGDMILASFVTDLKGITKNSSFSLNPEKVNEFAQILGEAHFYSLCKNKGIQLERVKETSEKRPDFSLSGQDVFFEVKTLSVVTGETEIKRSLEDALDAKISIEDQVQKGKMVAFGESVSMPYGDKPYKNGTVSAVIDTLLEKIRQNLKPEQFSLGPTFLVVNLSMIPPLRTENIVLRPAYCDDYLFPKAVSGQLWFVAFGQPGAPILGIPEFEGEECVESTMEKLGILVDEEYSFLKGILFIIHPLRRPTEIWSLERQGIVEDLSKSNPDLINVLRTLTGNNWNDEADRNGWRLSGSDSSDA